MRESLSSSEDAELYRLFEQYYSHVSRDLFERDLDDKDWVLMLRDRHGVVKGFTTLKLYDTKLLGRRVRALFNGNTIIDQAYWGEQELVRTWCRFMAQLKMAEPEVALYWYLICSGYRTYMFLPLFFKNFYPRFDGRRFSLERFLVDYFGELKFAQEYNDGGIHMAEPRECLRPELARPSSAKLRNPHVRFFVDSNPGYLGEGQERDMTIFSRKGSIGGLVT